MPKIYARTMLAASISEETQNEILSKTLREFHSQIRTDEDAIEELARIQLETAPAVCPNYECRSTNLSRPAGSREAKCNDCHTKIRIFAKTVFRNMRVPRAWLLAIWLKENGVEISASQLAQLANIATSTAAAMSKALMSIISQCFDEAAIQVHSGHFMEIFSKRSNQTPAERHPSAEQEEYERKFDPDGVITDRYSKMEEPGIVAMPQGWMELTSGAETEFDYIDAAASLAHSEISTALASSANAVESDEESDSQEASDPLDVNALAGEDMKPCDSQGAFCDGDDTNIEKVAARIYKLFDDRPLSFDEICDRTGEQLGQLFFALNYLSELGLVKRGTGGLIYKLDPKNVKHSKPGRGAFLPMAVTDFVFFIRQKFQGISRKYLQLYISSYWCYLDRVRWGPGCLMKECFVPKDLVTADDLNGFVSPLLVQFVPA